MPVRHWKWRSAAAATRWPSTSRTVHTSLRRLSKGVEKRDKVRTRVIAATLSDHIKSSDHIFIMGHTNSDLDAVGAAVGVWRP